MAMVIIMMVVAVTSVMNLILTNLSQIWWLQKMKELGFISHNVVSNWLPNKYLSTASAVPKTPAATMTTKPTSANSN